MSIWLVSSSQTATATNISNYCRHAWAKGIKENAKVYKEYFNWNEKNVYSDSRKYEGLLF